MNIDLEILFFAKAREIVGKKSSNITLPTHLTYIELSRKIVEEFRLEIIEESIIIALNEEFCTEESQIHLREGDKLAVIPPLSGG